MNQRCSMNKTALREFAIWARRTLINACTERAFAYGITEHGVNDPKGTDDITPAEMQQREQLIGKIQENGFACVMEEAAYTWFNRFTALRYMEVNGYLPSRVRVFTDEDGGFSPEILREAHTLQPEGTDRDHILALLEKQDMDALYKYLLIAQCNALHESLPAMFEEIGGWTELLFPAHLLRKGSILHRMVTAIPETDWCDQVQIIGWLYQYYNTDPKDELTGGSRKYTRVGTEHIALATQLFTPDWIVRYLVENTLGRLWLEGHQDSRIREQFPYYLDGADSAVRGTPRSLLPEEITFLDPCMGSGHMLVYAFDVLMQIYVSCGWSERDAAVSIVEHNLYGLDLDKRAYQLAYFAVMMKARQYDRRFLTRCIQPHLSHFQELPQPEGLPQESAALAAQFRNADIYGSLLTVEQTEGLEDMEGDAQNGLSRLVQLCRLLTRRYDVVCTNPPYMSAARMPAVLSELIQTNYADYKSDLFSAFMVRCAELTRPEGYLGFLTPYVWMFIGSYENLRRFLYQNQTLTTLVQFAYSAFEEATVPICMLTLKNSRTQQKACCIRLTDAKGSMEIQRQKVLAAIRNHDCGYYYESSADALAMIPGMPVAYWLSAAFVRAFEKGTELCELGQARQGIIPGNVEVFVRFWFEVSICRIGLRHTSASDINRYGCKWFAYNKGGSFRKWYGNILHVINMFQNGSDIRNSGKNHHYRLREPKYYFKEAVTWSKISSGAFSARYMPPGCLSDIAGGCIYEMGDELEYLLGFVNSVPAAEMLKVLSPTLNYEIGQIKRLPVLSGTAQKENIRQLVQENISLSEADWNSFEISPDFRKHPLV